MLKEKAPVSVLVVSNGQKAVSYFNEILPERQFSPVISVSTAGEAKRKLIENSFDIVMVNTPLQDEFGVQFAIDLSHSSESGILLFVKSENYEQVSYKTEEYGVITLARPTNRNEVFRTINMLLAASSRMRELENKNETLESKMKEIRLVNRAKLLLMEKQLLTEAEAHRYIEKKAMDNCVKKSSVAQKIINMYE